MIVLFLVLLVSLVPVILLYLWMKKLFQEKEGYELMCKKSLFAGMLSTLPILFVSLTFNIIINIMFKDRSSLVYKFFYTFFTLAFSEELCKSYFMFKTRKDNQYVGGWIETMIFMCCVGIGFEILESIVYAFGTNAIQILVRGFTAMHACFGLLMGYFFGKAEYTNNKKYYAYGFIFPWLLHGLYDFSLDPVVLESSDFFLIAPFAVILVCFIVLFKSIQFIRKNKDNPMYFECHTIE